MRRAARLMLRSVAGVLVLVLVAFAALVAVPTLLGYQTYAITTGSMAGTADPGSLVIARDVPVSELVVGDVITYVPPPETGIGHPVTHRLSDIEEQADGTRLMTTKGDANATEDPWEFTLDAHVQPRMVLAVPHVGRPLLWLADRTLRMVAIGIPALLIAAGALVDVVRAWRGDEEDAEGDGDGRGREPVDLDPDLDPDGSRRLVAAGTSSGGDG